MFHEMRYVYEVYRQQSFSQAAKALFISQPSLSVMIKKAERRIGSPIFDRSTLPIGLTEAGKAYIRAARQIIGIEEEFSQYLSDVEHCLIGTLSLGGTTMFMSYILPPLISLFSARYPRVQLQLQETHTVSLKRSLREGTLDLAVDNGDFDPSVYTGQIYQRERIMLAVPASLPVNNELAPFRVRWETLSEGAPLEQTPAVPLRVLQNEDFLLLKEGNDTRERAEKLCFGAGFQPRIRLQLDQQIAAYNLAVYGMGVAFVSETLARRAPRDERLIFYRLEGEEATRNIRIFYKQNRLLSQPMKAFLGCCEDEALALK